MTKGRAGMVVMCGWLLAPTVLAAQSAPELSKEQRTLLQTVVQAVDAAATQPVTPDVRLQTHVLRASDGSHYVAFSIHTAQPNLVPPGPMMLYVRLATAAPSQGAAERSAVREWLAGNRALPPPTVSSGIVLGEMPTMGVTGNLALRSPAASGSTDLQLMTLERQRARERQAARDAQRRAELEGTTPTSSEMMPFEDFDLAARAAVVNGTRVIRRALTAGPGDYRLSVAWADPAAPAAIQVVTQPLHLSPASADTLLLSSIIVASGVQVRDRPYPPSEQAANPYAIGLTEITPAPDSVFKNDEELAVAFQIINPRPAGTGKPDVEVSFDMVRVEGNREQSIASLTPRTYSEANLPADFDLRAGHPLLAAISAPLSTLEPGRYRLAVTANDRIAGTSARAATDFTIAATAASLLRDAPSLAPPFRADPFVGPEILPFVIRTLRPASPSPSLARALELAEAGRFVELVDDPVTELEQGVSAALTGLALLAMGDGSAAVHFQRAALLGAPRSATRLLSGAARALQGRDADAIAAWQEALAARAPWAMVAPFLLDAHVRRGDYQRAAALIADTKAPPATAAWVHSTAATRIAMRQEADAIALLDGHLTRQPSDAVAQWLLVHALYSQVVHGETANRGRLVSQAQSYIDARGAHAALARDWLAAIGDQGAKPK